MKNMLKNLVDWDALYFILENAPVSFEILDKNKTIIYCNKARKKLTGHEESEIIGKKINNFLTPDSKEKFNLFLSNGFKNSSEIQLDVIAKNKQVIPVELSFKTLMDKNEQTAVLITYAYKKASEKRQPFRGNSFNVEALKALTENETKYQTLFEKSNDAIFILIEDLFVDCNEAAQKLFAASKERLLASSVIDFIPKKDGNDETVRIVTEKIKLAFNGEPQSFRLELCRMDKKAIHAEIELSPFSLNNMTFVQAIIHDITEKYTQWLALQKSESIFKGVVNASHEAIIGVNKKGVCFLFNPAAEKMFLRTEKEMLGKSIDCLIPERYKEAHNRAFNDIFKTRNFDRLVNKTYRVDGLRSNGEEFPLEFSFSMVAVKDETFIVSSGRDITDRVKKENALKESEQKFRHLFEDMPDAIFITSLDADSKGLILDANRAAEQQTGYTREELLNMNILSQLCADKNNSQKALAREKEIAANKEIRFVEKKIRKDKTEYWTEVILRIISLNGTDVLISINRDVTDKIIANEKITKLSYAIEKSPIFVIITDPKGTIEYANRQASEITGYRQNELIGRLFRYDEFSVFPKEMFKSLWSTLETEDNWHSEFEMNLKNDKKIFVSATVFPIKNESDEVVNFIGMLEDRTDQRKLREQLSQAQKMETVGRLTGGIAHDFNNLLTVINGYSELASTIKTKDKKVHEYFRAIFRAGERASDLVRQLLAFTRKQSAEIKVVNLNTMIQDLTKMMARLIGKDIQIKTELDPQLPYIKADPVQIEQILINLVVNARDALNENRTGNSERKIIIATKAVSFDHASAKATTDMKNGDYVLFSVSDTGSGMPEDVKDKIFEPFFTTKETGKGTGLGLATVYGIVEQNNGKIEVLSELNKGTQFNIYWPAVDITEDSVELQKETFVPAVGHKHVLIVDDDEEVRALASEMLQALNYQVTEANNGKQALHLLKEASCKPDLIITDLIMPEMDGIEFANKTKQILPDVKFLYASGFAGDRFKTNSKSEIEELFIQKPYTLHALGQKIREVLDSTN